MTKIGKSPLWLFWIFSILFVAQAATAKVAVQATVESDEVTVGDPFPLVVTINSDETVETQSPRPPDFDGFELLGQSKSSSVRQQLVQGPHGMEFQTQRALSFHYDLRALRAGRLSIGAFEVQANGKTLRTQPIVLNALAPGQGTQQRGQAQRRGSPRNHQIDPNEDPMEQMLEQMDSFDDEIFNQLLQRRQQNMKEPEVRTMPINPNEAFFIQVEADKKEVFENEQVTVNWYIYTRGNIESLDRVKFPDLKGFWKEIIEENPTIQFQEEIINGIPYRKALLASHALFPIKPGTAVIDDFKIKARVRLMGQGGFGFGPAYDYTKSSQRIEIKVKPLPNEGRPASFTGAVGVFQVHATPEKEEVPINQPFSLKIRFEGAGNAKMIELPKIDWPSSVEVYDTKSESKFFKNGTSYKEFEVLLIPRQKGEITIPNFEFSFFEPTTKKYAVEKTAPIKITVVDNPNGNNEEGKSSRLATKGTEASAPGVATMPSPITDWQGGSSSVLKMPTMIILYLLGIIILLARAVKLFGLTNRQPRFKAQAEKRKKKVLDLLAGKKWREAGAEGVNTLHFIVGTLLGERGGIKEFSAMVSELPSTIKSETKKETLNVFNDFQTIGFAPDAIVESYCREENINKLNKRFSSVVEELLKYGEE